MADEDIRLAFPVLVHSLEVLTGRATPEFNIDFQIFKRSEVGTSIRFIELPSEMNLTVLNMCGLNQNIRMA